MTTHPGFWLTSLVVGVLLVPLPLAAGQGIVQVPIHGVTGTIATPDSVDRFYTDLNKTLEKTGDAFRPARKIAKADSDDASFARLQPGITVAVRYTVKGLAASDTEGIVTNVDRSRKRITIRFADGATETLRASEHPMRGGRVIVFYPDESGRNAPHYFKPGS